MTNLLPEVTLCVSFLWGPITDVSYFTDKVEPMGHGAEGKLSVAARRGLRPVLTSNKVHNLVCEILGRHL